MQVFKSVIGTDMAGISKEVNAMIDQGLVYYRTDA